MTDTLFEIADLLILATLWFTLGGDLAVTTYLVYALVGFALEYISFGKNPEPQ